MIRVNSFIKDSNLFFSKKWAFVHPAKLSSGLLYSGILSSGLCPSGLLSKWAFVRSPKPMVYFCVKPDFVSK